MLSRRINMPVILLSYHSFLRFSVNFLSHNQAVKFDIKIARKQVLVSILSHNLSHKLPRQPPLFLITRAFFSREITSIGKRSTFWGKEFMAQIGMCVGKPAEGVAHILLDCRLSNSALRTPRVKGSAQVVQLMPR